MSKTSIEWVANDDGSEGRSWQVTRGCERISPGCGRSGEHPGGCYAEKIAGRFCDVGQPFHGFAEIGKRGAQWTRVVKPLPENLTEPFGWRKPSRVFVNSMSDLFHKDVPFEYIAAVFGVMAGNPQHRFMVLTKRADRMLEWFQWVQSLWVASVVSGQAAFCVSEFNAVSSRQQIIAYNASWPLRNVSIGVSVEDQARAEERVPLLIQCPAEKRFVSLEPQLESVSLKKWGPPFLHLIIQGGESGGYDTSHPFNMQWARDMRAETAETGTMWFFKQAGRNPVDAVAYRSQYPDPGVFNPSDVRAEAPLCRLRLRHAKGGDLNELPAVLRVREML